MNAAVAYEETGRESLANEQLYAFLDDEETRSSVLSATRARWPNATLHDGGLPAALGVLSQEPSPSILIVDVSEADASGSALKSLIALCDAATRIVALGTVNDIGHYRSLIALGVSDYVLKPVDESLLKAAIDGPRRHQPVLREVEREAPRQVVSVIGARGGVGASTIAANLAWIAAHEFGSETAIVDLDLQFGTIGLQLDLEPSHGLREVLENPDRIDSLFVASAMSNESENLFVLNAEETLDETVRVSADAAGRLLDALPDSLQGIYLDVPVRCAVAEPRLLERSTRIVLVSDLSLAGMRDVARLARLCRDAAPDASLHTVLNRVGIARKGEIPKSEFIRGIDLPIAHSIPFDATLAAQSASTGKPFPVVAGGSAAVKVLRALARDLSGPGNDRRPAGVLRQLVSFGRRKS